MNWKTIKMVSDMVAILAFKKYELWRKKITYINLLNKPLCNLILVSVKEVMVVVNLKKNEFATKWIYWQYNCTVYFGIMQTFSNPHFFLGVNSRATAYKESDQIGFSGLLGLLVWQTLDLRYKKIKIRKPIQ